MNLKGEAAGTNDRFSPPKSSNGDEVYGQDRFVEQTSLLSESAQCFSYENPTTFSPVPLPSPTPPKSVPDDKHFPQYPHLVGTSTGSTDPLQRRDNSQVFHSKRKLTNFRSDSVFSDVMPIASSSSSTDHRKSDDSGITFRMLAPSHFC